MGELAEISSKKKSELAEKVLPKLWSRETSEQQAREVGCRQQPDTYSTRIHVKGKRGENKL